MPPQCKVHAEELALFGGIPAFAEPRCVGTPNIGDAGKLFERMTAMLASRRLTNDGPLVREFEARVAEQAGVAHCVTVCNATIGLQIAMQACGLTGEVIVPAFTFIATAHSVAARGLTPVFAEIRRSDNSIDPEDVERCITERTSGILGVHLWGRPCDTDALERIARRHGLRLLFDAAHAFGCTRGPRPVGGFGDAEVFSFHATKFINAYEGGAIVTNDESLAQRARLIRNFGFADYDLVVCAGTNGKMTEASAAMGLTSLDSADRFLAANRTNHAQYASCLAGVEGVEVCSYGTEDRSNYSYVAISVDAAAFGMSRDSLRNLLWSEGVLARRYFYPGCHRSEPYASASGARRDLSITDEVAEKVLVLPTGTATSTEDVTAICQLIRVAAANPWVATHAKQHRR